MLIAHVTFTVSTENRQQAVDTLLSQSKTIREMPGCLSFIPFADPQDPQKVGVQHEWEDANSFAGYTSSDIFAESNKVLRAMMTCPPVSKRFEAKLIESVN